MDESVAYLQRITYVSKAAVSCRWHFAVAKRGYMVIKRSLYCPFFRSKMTDLQVWLVCTIYCLNMFPNSKLITIPYLMDLECSNLFPLRFVMMSFIDQQKRAGAALRDIRLGTPVRGACDKWKVNRSYVLRRLKGTLTHKETSQTSQDLSPH